MPTLIAKIMDDFQKKRCVMCGCLYVGNEGWPVHI
jgi:hypothetical protein